MPACIVIRLRHLHMIPAPPQDYVTSYVISCHKVQAIFTRFRLSMASLNLIQLSLMYIREALRLLQRDRSSSQTYGSSPLLSTLPHFISVPASSHPLFRLLRIPHMVARGLLHALKSQIFHFSPLQVSDDFETCTIRFITFEPFRQNHL